ncbi:MAG: VOC family protein [Tetrasphaera sp.]
METTTTSTRTDHNIWTSMMSADPLAAREWMAALGFEHGIVVPGEVDGEIQHSEMIWPEGGRVMVATAGKDDGEFGGAPGTVGVYVVTDHPDEIAARAQSLGAEFIRALEDAEGYASRGFTVRDPEGNSWSFGTYAG